MCNRTKNLLIKVPRCSNIPVLTLCLAIAFTYIPWHLRNTGVRILSIDGGGSRGLVVAMMLERIEKVLNLPEFHAGNHDNRVQIWQLFDLIIGEFLAGREYCSKFIWSTACLVPSLHRVTLYCMRLPMPIKYEVWFGKKNQLWCLIREKN